MHNTLIIALLAGLGGMLGWGIGDFFVKLTVDKLGDLKTLVWAHSFGASFFILIALLAAALGHGSPLPTHFSAWLGLVFFGVLQMIVYWLAYRGFAQGQVAVLNPVFASFPGIVAIVSILFLGEQFHLQIGIALVVMFAGIMLLNLDLSGLRSKKLNVTPGLKEVALAALLAAGWTLGWHGLVKGQNPLSYALLMYVFMSLAAYGAALITKTKLGGVDKNLWKFLAGIGACETIAYLAISWGYSATSRTSVVAMVSGAFSLPTILLARLYLAEKINRIQLLGAIATIVGIVTISVT